MTRKQARKGVDKPPDEQPNPMDYQRLKELLKGFIERDCRDYPKELDDLIRDTARTGIVRLPWELLKPLFHYRLDQVLKVTVFPLPQSDDVSKTPELLLEQLDKFDNPPFTSQRLCELILEPQKHYKRRDAYLRAVEKNLLVVSTQEPDLTWMKSPRLTQLLEEWPKPLPKEEQFPANSVSDSHLTENAELPCSQEDDLPNSPPNTTTPTWTNLRDVTGQEEQPVSEGDSEEDPSVNEVPSSSLTLLPSLPPERKPEREGLVGRKRSSSIRDSMELSVRSDSEEMGTVLQEADSTVVIEQPQVVSMEEASLKRLRDEEESTELSSFSSQSDSNSLKILLERRLPHPEGLPEAKLREDGDSNGRHTKSAGNVPTELGLKQDQIEEMDTD